MGIVLTSKRSTPAVYRDKTLARQRLDIAVSGALGSIRPTKSKKCSRTIRKRASVVLVIDIQNAHTSGFRYEIRAVL